jgi:hypothetical protein
MTHAHVRACRYRSRRRRGKSQEYLPAQDATLADRCGCTAARDPAREARYGGRDSQDPRRRSTRNPRAKREPFRHHAPHEEVINAEWFRRRGHISLRGWRSRKGNLALAARATASGRGVVCNLFHDHSARITGPAYV